MTRSSVKAEKSVKSDLIGWVRKTEHIAPLFTPPAESPRPQHEERAICIRQRNTKSTPYWPTAEAEGAFGIILVKQQQG